MRKHLSFLVILAALSLAVAACAEASGSVGDDGLGGDDGIEQSDPGVGGPGDGGDAADAYLGLAASEAIAQAEAEGRVWRIAVEDGEQFMLTMDYVPARINFEIEAGVVTGAWMG